MKKIHVLKYKFLRNEGHLQFLAVFKGLIETQGVVVILSPAEWALFLDLFGKEKLMVDITRISEISKQLKKADARQDRAIVGIKGAITYGTHHFDPEVVVAAEQLSARIKEFGQIINKPYEEEVAAVDILLSELNGTLAPQVAKLNLQPMVNELAAANTEFQQLFVLRNAQNTARPHICLFDIRSRIDVVYHGITDFIESTLTVTPTDELQHFVDLLNTQIDYFNEHHVHHSSKIQLSNVVFDLIPDQRLIGGRPATPMPVVKHDDQILTFLTDYEIVYRHNNKIGTASVVVKGKGGYTGRRELNFNIVKDTDKG